MSTCDGGCMFGLGVATGISVFIFLFMTVVCTAACIHEHRRPRAEAVQAVQAADACAVVVVSQPDATLAIGAAK